MISAESDCAGTAFYPFGYREARSLSRFRVLRDGRISYRVKKSSRRLSRCRIMTPLECIARLCALVPPPRYPLTRFHGVLAPRAKLRPRIVPKLPGSAPRACASASSRLPDRGEPRGRAGERPPPRDKTGPIIPAGVPVSATTLARRIDGADVPMPNVLSVRHLARIGGGLLYAATSNVPWATLLARTFDVDVKACARCSGRLEVRAVVTDHAIACKIRRCLPDRGSRSAGRRRDPRLRTCVRVTDREPMASYVLRPTLGNPFGHLPPARPPERSPRAPSSQPLRATVSYALYAGADPLGTSYLSLSSLGDALRAIGVASQASDATANPGAVDASDAILYETLLAGGPTEVEGTTAPAVDLAELGARDERDATDESEASDEERSGAGRSRLRA
jgi:hypothetical protein